MGAMKGVRRIEVVANVASGGVGRTAPGEIEQILSAYGLAAHVCAPEAHDLTNSLRAAVAAAPDLLIVLAGDGTARAAAELCGSERTVDSTAARRNHEHAAARGLWRTTCVAAGAEAGA